MRVIRIHTQTPAEEAALAIEELPVPEPAPGQVRIRVRVCGVCHTDLHTLEGDIRPPRLPVVPGHQVVGVVDAAGDGAPLHVGERVGAAWLGSACGRCAHCLRGEENLCEEARFTGFDFDGGYAENMLADARYVFPLPDAIPDDQAAPLLCAGLVGYRSLRLADIEPGERVGLAGFGASAHLCIQVLVHWGCEVFVFTRSETHRSHARELGAVWAGGVEEDFTAIRGLSRGLLDRAVIFAPSGPLVPAMLAKIRPGGTLAVNAIHTTPIPEMPYRLLWGERTLRSVANATYRDGVEFLKLAAEIPVRATVTEYPFEDANRALLDMKHSKINGEAVLRIAR